MLNTNSVKVGGFKVPAGSVEEAKYKALSGRQGVDLVSKSFLDSVSSSGSADHIFRTVAENMQNGGFLADSVDVETMDAVDVGSVFAKNFLTAVEQKIYSKKYQENNYRLLTNGRLNNTGGPGAERVQWHYMDHVGEAKVISSGAKDLPLVNHFLKTFEEKTVPFGIAFEWDWRYEYQLDLARRWTDFSGISVFQELVNFGATSLRLMDNLIQKLTWYGDPAHGLSGLLTNSLLADKDTAKVAFNSGGSVDADRLWSAKTFDEIVKDLQEACFSTTTNTNGISDMTFMATDLFISHERYWQAKEVIHQYKPDVDPITAFMTKNPGIRVHACPELDASRFTSGTLSGFSVMIALNTQSDEVIDNHVPMLPTIWTPATTKEGGFFNPVYGVKGSLVTRNPKAIVVRYAF